jgi:hypothetical protein
MPSRDKSKDGRYRKIKVRTWGDEKFRRLSAPPPNGQFLWFHLLTGPHTTAIPGLSSIGEAGLSEALGWPLKAFRRCWREVEAQAMAQADWQARVIFLPHAILHNEPESPSVVKGWIHHLVEIPECDLKNQAIFVIGSHLAKMGPVWAAAWVPGWNTVWSPASPSSGTCASSGAGTGAGTGTGVPPVGPPPAAMGSLPDSPPEQSHASETPEALLAVWQEYVPISRRNGLPGFVMTRELSAKWRISAACRLKEAELAWHRKAIDRLSRSKWACGGMPPSKGHSKPFRASFDWYVASESNCLKCYEGRYDD